MEGFGARLRERTFERVEYPIQREFKLMNEHLRLRQGGGDRFDPEQGCPTQVDARTPRAHMAKDDGLHGTPGSIELRSEHRYALIVRISPSFDRIADAECSQILSGFIHLRVRQSAISSKTTDADR